MMDGLYVNLTSSIRTTGTRYWLRQETRWLAKHWRYVSDSASLVQRTMLVVRTCAPGIPGRTPGRPTARRHGHLANRPYNGRL